MKRSIRILRLASFALLILLAAMVPPVLGQEGTRIIFLHHSCGQNLIEEGGVREGLTGLGYEFYDHGYNDEGLRDADGFSALSKAEAQEIANIMIALVEGSFYILDMDGENVSPRRMARITRRFLELYAEERMREKRAKEDQ